MEGNTEGKIAENAPDFRKGIKGYSKRKNRTSIGATGKKRIKK